MIRSILSAVACCLLFTQCGAAAPSVEAKLTQLTATISDAGACVTADTCILAGKSNCSCDAPVNAAARSQIDAQVAQLNQTCRAEDFLGDCQSLTRPRCEAGRCVADVKGAP